MPVFLLGISEVSGYSGVESIHRAAGVDVVAAGEVEDSQAAYGDGLGGWEVD